MRVQYIDNLYKCKSLRIKNICLNIGNMLAYFQSSFFGEYCDKISS